MMPVAAPRAPFVNRAAKPVLGGLALRRTAASRPTRKPAAVAAPAAGLRVSQPQDAAEGEARRVAARAVALPARPVSATAARFAGLVPAAPAAPSGGSGQPLPLALRRDMETRLGADLSAVRIHTGTQAAQSSRRLNAAAYTVGRDVHFGQGRFQPGTPAGRELLAHELVHTVQQGASPQARQVVARSVDETQAPRIQERSPPQVQRLGIQDALDWFADKAAHIPGFRMFTLLLGFNPISLRSVSRTAANLLRALIELLPGGHLITQALDNHGIVDQVAGWVGAQLDALGDIGSSIRQSIDDFLDSLSWTDIFDLGGLWNRVVHLVTSPIDSLIRFGTGLISGIVEFIKNAILRPLGSLAEGTRGYPLLKAVLGFDPVTGDPVPRTAATLLGGFMTMIGQEEVWQNIQRGNAVGQAWAWFQGALSGALALVSNIPALFMEALRSLELVDIVLLHRAFAKVGRVFGRFVSGFISWALGTVIKLLEIIFSVVAPGAMGYLRRAGGALQAIFRDPIGFVGNLVRAGMTGLRQFAQRFLTHLRAGLIGWLTGALGGTGVYIPQGFSLMEIARFGLSVLGLTWQHLRERLVRLVGETSVRAMEGGFDLVRTLLTQGPAAAWQQIVASLGNLREMVMEQVMNFVRQRIVQAAIARLLTSLNPAGAFIQAIIAIYNTVMFFTERLRQIAQVARSVIDSLAAIAGGQIGAAANRVEQTLAGLLTLVISFLARLVGLGSVADAVRNVINRVRAPIERALDRLVQWIVDAARRVGRFVAQAGVPNDPDQRMALALRAAAPLMRRLSAGQRLNAGLVAGLVGALKVRYGLQALVLVREGTRWFLQASINPQRREEIGEAEADLLQRIYAVADQEYAAARARRGPVTGAGTHDSPLVMPRSGGLADTAAHLPDDLRRGGLAVVDVTQGSSTDLRGAIRRPPFAGGDAIVSGASATQRQVRIGAYGEVAQQLSAYGNDRYVAQAAAEVLRGGDLPASMHGLAPWFGGFKTLMAVEVRRDPIALVTLSSVLALAAAGALPISAAFARAQQDASRPAGATGGLFPHSAAPALAPLRGLRENVDAPLPANAPASRGTVDQRIDAARMSIDAIVRGARLRLGGASGTPPTSEIVAAVRQVMRDTLGG